LGIAVVFNYHGLAAHVATFIAGRDDRDRFQTRATTDRLWGILPLSLGLGVPLSLVVGRVNDLAGALIGLPAVAIYWIVMMRLAWMYTPPERRALGPLFWTRRAAAIPLVAFFADGGLLSLITVGLASR